MHTCHTDRVGEAVERGQVVADIAPGMMGAVRGRNRARPIVPPHSLDFVGDQVERFLP